MSKRSKNKIETADHVKCTAIHLVKTINIDNEYHKLVEKFPSITKFLHNSKIF